MVEESDLPNLAVMGHPFAKSILLTLTLGCVSTSLHHYNSKYPLLILPFSLLKYKFGFRSFECSFRSFFQLLKPGILISNCASKMEKKSALILL
jgi:hypothetical protein